MKKALLISFLFSITSIVSADSSSVGVSREDYMNAIREGRLMNNTETTQAQGEINAVTQQQADQAGGFNSTNFMIGAGIARNLASFAFDAETAQKVTGAIDIATGGVLIPTNCPPPHTPGRLLKCVYGVSAIANGAASIRSSRKSKDAGKSLGGDGTPAGSTSAGTDIPPCNPVTNTNCTRIHCSQHPLLSICPPLSPHICSDGTPCPASGICPNGYACTPNPNPSICPNGYSCPVNGICPDGVTICGNPTTQNGCPPDGTPCPANGQCPDGSTCNPPDPNRNVSCDENPNQLKCNLPDTTNDDPCLEMLGTSCDDLIVEECLQLPYCRIVPPDNTPSFLDLNGNPIPPGDLNDVARHLGLNPDEIQDIKDEIDRIHQNAANQAGGGGASSKSGGLNGHGASSSTDGTEALSTDNFEPSLSNGGGGSQSSRRNKDGQGGANSPDLSRQLQSLLNKNKNYRSAVKKHGYTPKKLGNQPIGTSHDNIFDMMSRGYQTRENSLSVR